MGRPQLTQAYSGTRQEGTLTVIISAVLHQEYASQVQDFLYSSSWLSQRPAKFSAAIGGCARPSSHFFSLQCHPWLPQLVPRLAIAAACILHVPATPLALRNLLAGLIFHSQASWSSDSPVPGSPSSRTHSTAKRGCRALARYDLSSGLFSSRLLDDDKR